MPEPRHATATANSSLGLKGVWAAVANLTAVGLIAVMFYQAQGEMFRLAREDRAMFRAELDRLHEDSVRKWKVLQRLDDDVREIRRRLGEGKDGAQP